MTHFGVSVDIVLRVNLSGLYDYVIQKRERQLTKPEGARPAATILLLIRAINTSPTTKHQNRSDAAQTNVSRPTIDLQTDRHQVSRRLHPD